MLNSCQIKGWVKIIRPTNHIWDEQPHNYIRRTGPVVIKEKTALRLTREIDQLATYHCQMGPDYLEDSIHNFAAQIKSKK